jgi:hypothetical protein
MQRSQSQHDVASRIETTGARVAGLEITAAK